jgi:hypothetical protein
MLGRVMRGCGELAMYRLRIEMYTSRFHFRFYIGIRSEDLAE